MNSIRKLVMMLGVLLASSMFVACSDEEKTMGPISINSVQATSSAVTLYWTIVSNSNCDGYEVSIVEGTRSNKGAVVASEKFDNRTARGTFSGLKQNTSYVAITKGIPSSSSGFNDAYTFELEFMTTPLVQNIKTGAVTYKVVTSTDNDGNEVKQTLGTVTATWNALKGNAGTYTVTLQKANGANWGVVSSVTVSNIATSSQTFADVIVPATKYRVGVIANPGNGEWYAAGEWQYYEFTSPAAN